MVPNPSTVAVIRRVLAALDYAALGEVYCDHGGLAFWSDRRQPVLDLGLRWARELGKRLQRGGASLYMGAGVAEIPAMIVEALDLERAVGACNRRAEECAILNRALAAEGVPLTVCADDARNIVGRFDHVSMVSVLCDPETFPVVAEVTYGRVHPVHLDVDALARERQVVADVVATVFGRIDLPGHATTTVEEVPWVLSWAEAHGVQVVADETMVETAVVGDPIGFLALSAAPST